MKLTFAHSYLLSYVRLANAFSQPLKSDTVDQLFGREAINLFLLKRSDKEEGKDTYIYDKDLKVSYLPSETNIATNGRSKLQSRKFATSSISQNSNQRAVLSEKMTEQLRPNYEYRPRKEASEYSQERKAREYIKQMANIRQNDQSKYAEILRKARIRKNRFAERTKNNAEVRDRAITYKRTHNEKLKKLRHKVRMGTADEDETRFVAHLRQREKEHKAKTAKNKKSKSGSG